MALRDDRPGAEASSTLTESEIASLVAGIVHRTPPADLVAGLRNLIVAEPDTLTAIIRCLVVEAAPGATAALEQLVRADGSAGADVGRFQRVGDYWEISYGGRSVLLRHTRGLGYLARLLGRPGERVYAEELVRKTRAGAQGAELARVSVTKAVKAAIARIAQVDPELGDHLAVTVRRGTFCVYLPDPRRPIRWTM